MKARRKSKNVLRESGTLQRRDQEVKGQMLNRGDLASRDAVVSRPTFGMIGASMRHPTK